MAISTGTDTMLNISIRKKTTAAGIARNILRN